MPICEHLSLNDIFTRHPHLTEEPGFVNLKNSKYSNGQSDWSQRIGNSSPELQRIATNSIDRRVIYDFLQPVNFQTSMTAD